MMPSSRARMLWLALALGPSTAFGQAQTPIFLDPRPGCTAAIRDSLPSTEGADSFLAGAVPKGYVGRFPIDAPAGLDAAGPQRSELEYVLDTLGRVEPCSLQIVWQTSRVWTEAVGEALLKFRFRPATLHGHPFRVRVRQAFNYVPDQ